MSESFEFPKADWKPLSIAPLHFGAYLTNGFFDGSTSYAWINNEPSIFALTDDAFYNKKTHSEVKNYLGFNFLCKYLSLQNEVIENFEADTILKDLKEYVIDNITIDIDKRTGLAYFIIEGFDEAPLEIERYYFANYYDEHRHSKLGTIAQPLKFIPENRQIAWQPLVMNVFSKYIDNFYNGINKEFHLVHARVGSLFSRKYEIIPLSVFQQLKIDSWSDGIASFGDNEKIYDIHISLNPKAKILKNKIPLKSKTFNEIGLILSQLTAGLNINEISVKELAFQIQKRLKEQNPNSKEVVYKTLYEYARLAKKNISEIREILNSK
jgi:hypothetical protein